MLDEKGWAWRTARAQSAPRLCLTGHSTPNWKSWELRQARLARRMGPAAGPIRLASPGRQATLPGGGRGAAPGGRGRAPGATQLTRMPAGPSSSASALDSATSAVLLTAYSAIGASARYAV